MYSVITVSVAILIIAAAFYASKKIPQSKFFVFQKVLAVAYFVFGIVRMFLRDSFVEEITDFADPYQTFLRWFAYISYSTYIMATFFDSRLFKNIAVCFSLPVSLLSVISFEGTFKYFLSDAGEGFVIDLATRYGFYIIELAVSVAIPVLFILCNKHIPSYKNRGEILRLVTVLPVILLFVMPAYIPQALLGSTEISTKSFGPMHFAWIAVMIAACIVFHLVFKNKSYNDRYMLCLFIALTELIHTHQVFLRGFTVSRLPLQLCCISGFFYVFALATKNRKFFDFCYLANTLGAVIAIALASYSEGALTFWNIHYMQEHGYVLILPILTMSLHVFPRINITAIKHTLLIFCCYFFSCFIIGTLINGLSATEGYAVNYFYMFNHAVALEYLPFVGFTGVIHWQFGSFGIYPILVLLIFVVFSTLFVAFYFFTRLIYKISDKIQASKKSNSDIDILTTV